MAHPDNEAPAGVEIPGSRSSPAHIFWFIKFLEKEAHVKDLLDGRLYANRLSWFKRHEPRERAGRSDQNEGTSSWMQPDRVELVINGWNMTPDLAGPVQTQPNRLDSLNVFCVHAVHDGGNSKAWSNRNVEDLRRQLLVPERCLDLGRYAVVIHNVPEFMRRFDAAIRGSGYRGWSHLVRYYDPAIFHGTFDGIDPVFRKQNQYSYQREYRFVIDTGSVGNDAVVLGLGDIRDITWLCAPGDLNGRNFLGGELSLHIRED